MAANTRSKRKKSIKQVKLDNGRGASWNANDKTTLITAIKNEKINDTEFIPSSTFANEEDPWVAIAENFIGEDSEKTPERCHKHYLSMRKEWERIEWMLKRKDISWDKLAMKLDGPAEAFGSIAIKPMHQKYRTKSFVYYDDICQIERKRPLLGKNGKPVEVGAAQEEEEEEQPQPPKKKARPKKGEKKPAVDQAAKKTALKKKTKAASDDGDYVEDEAKNEASGKVAREETPETEKRDKKKTPRVGKGDAAMKATIAETLAKRAATPSPKAKPPKKTGRSFGKVVEEKSDEDIDPPGDTGANSDLEMADQGTKVLDIQQKDLSDAEATNSDTESTTKPVTKLDKKRKENAAAGVAKAQSWADAEKDKTAGTDELKSKQRKQKRGSMSPPPGSPTGASSHKNKQAKLGFSAVKKAFMGGTGKVKVAKDEASRSPSPVREEVAVLESTEVKEDTPEKKKSPSPPTIDITMRNTSHTPSPESDNTNFDTLSLSIVKTAKDEVKQEPYLTSKGKVAMFRLFMQQPGEAEMYLELKDDIEMCREYLFGVLEKVHGVEGVEGFFV